MEEQIPESSESTAISPKLVVGICLFGVLAGVGLWKMGAVHSIVHWTHWKIKPTYSRDGLALALKKMTASDYHLRIEARQEGNGLQAFFWKVGLLKPGQLEMKVEAAEALERVLLCATRVSLSTDAPLQFIEVKMSDVLTGASVSLWRYVPDIRDSMYTRMAEEEYINRLVIEMNTESPGRLGDWREIRWDAPMTLEKFLAKQVILRAKRQSTIGIQAHEDLSKPETLIIVVDNWATIEEQGVKEKTKVADLVEASVKNVLTGYRFNGFHGVVLKDSNGLPLRSWQL